MKTTTILTSALTALLSLSGFAQSPAASGSTPATQPIPAVPPVAPAPPAPPAPPRGHIHEHDNRPKEPVTFLGVETSEVPRVLSEQMGLPKGFGVVVDYVVPKSAAATAGVQKSDIIRMLNDQQIVGSGQLGKLVRSFPEGTSVELTLMRKGQEMKVSVKLGKKDVSVNRGPFGFEQKWNFDDDNDDDDDMNFDFKTPDMTTVRAAVSAAVEQAKAEAARAGEDARRAARRLRIVTRDDNTTKSTRIDLGKATITFSDDQGELKVETRDGHQMLSAKDAQGHVLFNGPIDSEEERRTIPPAVRERFEKLQNQELPPVPPAPEPPEAPEAPQPNASVHLQALHPEQAALSPTARTGWRRSTILL